MWITLDSWFCMLEMMIIVSLPTGAVNPGCECVRYTSTWGKEWGVFQSPDFPSGYPRGIRCLLYSFSAPPGFIVHLSLDKVNLPQKEGTYQHNNGCVDYLKLFTHVDEVRAATGGHGTGGVNENTPWTTLICGQSSNLSYYSSSRHIIIQFHSSTIIPPPNKPMMMGDVANSNDQSYNYDFFFSGKYRFLNSTQFTSTGRLMTDTKCDYQFVGSEEEGRFFSPHYPSTYPYNIRCAYHFYASLHKRVRILFESISLQPGEYSCLNKTDVIRVIDGSNSNSPIIALICYGAKDYELLSSGPHLQVEFLANSDNPGTGFRAIYQYVQVELDSALDNTRLPLSPDVAGGHDGLPQASTLVPQCNQVISSDAGRNGSFSSPNYPHHYTPKTECRYIFIGHGKERVQIHFTDFSLYHPSEKSDPDSQFQMISSSSSSSSSLLYASSGGETQAVLSVERYLNGNRVNERNGQRKRNRCLGADTVSLWIYVDGQLEKMSEFCGHELPPPVMSNGHRLTLDFKGASNSHFSRGFNANYAFVEDFGIKWGRQLRDYPCGFVYNSTEISSGTFTSPNYPGIYPRNTECHYFFYGAYDDHVVLTFTYFHIEGFKTCSDSTKSDYLEFSNYMHDDPSYGRRCGVIRRPFRYISDRNFFRVSLRSNAQFDGGGFLASFHFTSQPREQLVAIHDHERIRLILPGGDNGDQVDLGFGEGRGTTDHDDDETDENKVRSSNGGETTLLNDAGPPAPLLLLLSLFILSTFSC